LETFISVRTRELVQEKQWHDKWIDKITFALTNQSGGTFLWAALVLNDISKVTRTKLIEAKLANLPSDLHEVYDRMLKNIPVDDMETAKHILQWVVVARRPLSISELAMIQALRPTEHEGRQIPSTDILEDFEDGYKCCIPILEVDRGTRTIHLIHQSVKDYLLGSAVLESQVYHTTISILKRRIS